MTHIQVQNWKKKCVSYVALVHTSRPTVFDLFLMCAATLQRLNYSGPESKRKQANKLQFMILTQL